jgi:hypothetical protein
MLKLTPEPDSTGGETKKKIGPMIYRLDLE